MAVRSDQVRRLGLGAAALLAGLMACAGAGWAQVSVSEPQPGTLVVDAHNATIDEVLAEIGRSRKVQLETAGPLAGVVSGTYRGTLSRVLLRLLDGYDVVIRSSTGGLQVRVFKPGEKIRVAAPAAGFALPPRSGASSNVDADDEKAVAATAPPRPAPVAAPPRPGPNTGPVASGPRVVASGPPLAPPPPPQVSSNVDLDQERSAGGN